LARNPSTTGRFRNGLGAADRCAGFFHEGNYQAKTPAIAILGEGTQKSPFRNLAARTDCLCFGFVKPVVGPAAVLAPLFFAFAWSAQAPGLSAAVRANWRAHRLASDWSLTDYPAHYAFNL
jgi:hypothetical protein